MTDPDPEERFVVDPELGDEVHLAMELYFVGLLTLEDLLGADSLSDVIDRSIEREIAAPGFDDPELSE